MEASRHVCVPPPVRKRCGTSDDVAFLKATWDRAAWSFETGWSGVGRVCRRLEDIERRGRETGRCGAGIDFITRFMMRYRYLEEGDEYMFFSACLVTYKASARYPSAKVALLKGVSKSLVYSQRDLVCVVDVAVAYADPDLLSALTCATSKADGKGTGKYTDLDISLRRLDTLGKQEPSRDAEMRRLTKLMFDPFARTNSSGGFVYIVNSKREILRTVICQMNYIAWCHRMGLFERAMEPPVGEKNVPLGRVGRRYVLEHMELREGGDECGKKVQDGFRDHGDRWPGAALVVS
jgi:hypothetical protein